MRICVLSDLHGNLISDIEPCELVLICGDIVPLKMQNNFPQTDSWLKKRFSKWINALPCEKVIIVAGNHDLAFQNREPGWVTATLLSPTNGKLFYLENELCEYVSKDCKLYSIFGTPYCHQFGNWAFMCDDDILVEKYNKLPLHCDIVISHDAPYGTSDICFESTWNTSKHLGNEPLRDAILEKRPTYLFHGHLHTSNHEEELLEQTKVYNTSILDEQYSIKFKPLYLEI